MYINIEKVSQNLTYVWANSLLKRNYFVAAILDFGGHFEFVSVLKVRN